MSIKKTVLLYNFNTQRTKMIRQSLVPLKCSVRAVMKKEYKQKIGFLVGEQGFEKMQNSVNDDFSDEMLVMHNFGSEMIDVLIAVLKRSGIGTIPLKAVTTPTNLNMNSAELYREIKAEHDIMTKKGTV